MSFFHNKRVKEVLLYTASSLFSTVLDYAVYIAVLFGFFSLVPFSGVSFSLFGRFIFRLSDISIAYLLARAISAVQNFYANNRWVFRQKGHKGIGKRFIKYMLLAILVALLGSLIVTLLHDKLKIQEILAKLITDVSIFVVSYFGQKLYVFRDAKPTNREPDV